jgi:S-adenosylmethionine uptake transporter
LGGLIRRALPHLAHLIICAPLRNPGRLSITASAAHRTAGDHIARGIAFALIAFSIFSCADAGVKWLTERYSVFQIIFVSNLFTLIPVALLIRHEGGLHKLRPRHPWLVGLRSILLAIDMVLVFYAFVELPLADAYALIFAVPMVVTALSVPILGEKVGWRRWSAVVVGFIGVLIVLRPGIAELKAGHIAAISSALFFGLSLILVRRMGKDESTGGLIFWMVVALLAVSAPVMPEVYVPMSWPDLGLLAVLGLLSGAGHLMLIRAFRLAPSAIVAPFHYSQMIWAVFFGLFLFGDIPDAWVISGSAVIIGSGLYILWRETVRRRVAGV